MYSIKQYSFKKNIFFIWQPTDIIMHDISINKTKIGIQMDFQDTETPYTVSKRLMK